MSIVINQAATETYLGTFYLPELPQNVLVSAYESAYAGRRKIVYFVLARGRVRKRARRTGALITSTYPPPIERMYAFAAD